MKYGIFLMFIICPITLKAQALFQYQTDVPFVVNDQFLRNPWAGGLNSASFNKVDLDNDGKDELLVYDRSADNFLVYQEVGGTWVLNNELGFVLPQLNAGWAVFADYNGDGKKDIYNAGERGMIVYKNISQANALAKWKIVANPLYTTGYSGKINLIANAVDIPGIADIDNDGDLDILVYDFSVGGTIRYNKNLSEELYHNADSLEYEITTRSWGEFEECDCNLFAFGGQTCADIQNGRVAHVGGKSILLFDNDGDGDKDVLIGHEQCEELYFFQNVGSADHALMTGFSAQFPNAQHPANMYIFPAGYYEDIDFDGVKDLMVSPNVYTNLGYMIDLKHSSWLYHNAGSGDHPDFQYVQNDFLQGDMLDLGEQTVPVLIDYDADGDYDLIVAANGFNLNGTYVGYLSLLENTGTPTDPAFETAQTDFLNLSSLQLNNPRIAISDFNGDGAQDLFYMGIKPASIDMGCYVFLNQALPDAPMQFDVNRNMILSLPIGLNDNVCFYDINKDGKTDLLVAKQNGALEYYENQGTGQEPQFNLVKDDFLGISRDFSLTRINLSVTVSDIDADGKPDLVTTDSRGMASIYANFQQDLNSTLVPDSIIFDNKTIGKKVLLPFGTMSWLAAADLFGDGTSSIVTGNIQGGLEILRNLEEGNNVPETNGLNVQLYPNPLFNHGDLHVKANQDVEIDIVTLLGQLASQPRKINKNQEIRIDVGYFTSGVYILRARDNFGHTAAHQFVVLH